MRYQHGTGLSIGLLAALAAAAGVLDSRAMADAAPEVAAAEVAAANLEAGGRKAALTSAGGQRTATNGILTITIQSSGSGAGQFYISTGARHPHPNQNVWYAGPTSFITLRDATHHILWVNRSSPPFQGLAGYSEKLMAMAPATAVVTPLGLRGFRTVYTLPGFVVTQDAILDGTTLANTNVLQQVRVKNTSTLPEAFGLRYLWDWKIADNDSSFFRTRNPNGLFNGGFTTFPSAGHPLNFPVYEEVDNPSKPTFSILGTTNASGLAPSPNPPEQVRYASWISAYSAAWDFPLAGVNDDSAVVYFWGFTSPLALAAGATATFSEYATTQPEAVIVPTPIPGGSPLHVSTAGISAAHASVQLRFDHPLSGATAAATTHYTVTVNGLAIAVTAASYNATAGIVTLQLPTTALRAGDLVQVSWHGLTNPTGSALAAGSFQGLAQ